MAHSCVGARTRCFSQRRIGTYQRRWPHRARTRIDVRRCPALPPACVPTGSVRRAATTRSVCPSGALKPRPANGAGSRLRSTSRQRAAPWRARRCTPRRGKAFYSCGVRARRMVVAADVAFDGERNHVGLAVMVGGMPYRRRNHQWHAHDQALPGLLTSELGDAQGLADHGRARQREQQAHGMQLPGTELPHAAPQLRTQRTLPGGP